MTTQTSNSRTINTLFAEFSSFDFGAGGATAYPVPSKYQIAECAMDDAALANAKDEALRDTLAGVQPVPADQRRQLHIISGLPGAFKSGTEQRLLQTLEPNSAANIDFDEYR